MILSATIFVTNKWVHIECTDMTPDQFFDYCNDPDKIYKCVMYLFNTESNAPSAPALSLVTDVTGNSNLASFISFPEI